MYRRISLLLTPALLAAGMMVAQSTTAPKADNTKVNKRDRSAAEPTADQQKENESDRKTTQAVRKALMADKKLSTYAHNVKIITQNGVVTLKGPVRTAEEKSTVEAKAAEAAGGADKVKSEITVAPAKS